MAVGSNIRFLIQRRGRAATLRVASGSSYNPATGQNVSSYTNYEIKAYFAQYMLGEAQTSEVSVGTRWVSFAPFDTSGNPLPRPDTEDQIVNAEDTVVISEVQTIYDGETPVVYLCMVSE